MMNIDVLIYGLSMVCLGLVGLIIKSNTNRHSYKSYTGVNFLLGTYILLLVGSLLIVFSFFSE